jgi:hypothetical protein
MIAVAPNKRMAIAAVGNARFVFLFMDPPRASSIEALTPPLEQVGCHENGPGVVRA